MYDGEVTVIPNRLERAESGVQAEKTVQVDGGVFTAVGYLRRSRYGDGGTHFVVALFGVRYHDVQPVGCAALEYGDQDFLARRGSIGSVQRALEPQWSRARPYHRQGRVTKEVSTGVHIIA